MGKRPAGESRPFAILVRMATEEFKVSGSDIIETVKRIIAQGNARRIIIKNESGDTLIEFPLTIGAIGALIAPVLAAVGAIAALVTKCTIVVERRDDASSTSTTPEGESTIEA
jgi:hypothetical protein